MSKDEKITTGWRIPREVKESFVDFCNDVGGVVEQDVAGALVLWPYMPVQVREQAKLHAKGNSKIDTEFWRQFAAGIEAALCARDKICEAQSCNPRHKQDNKKRS